MLISDLEDLGLSEEEARVYLAILELGGSYVSAIAKKAKVHRVSCYHTLDNLVRKGIVSTFTKDNIKYFSVDSPRILVNQLEEKFEKAQKMLPELLSITNSLAYKPKIQYYEGIQGIKNVFDDALNSDDEVLGYTNLAELPNVIPEDYLKEYAEQKIEKGLKTRMLSPLSQKALRYTKRYYPKGFDRNLVEIFFVNPEEFMFEYETNIYGDRVSMISLNPDEPIGMIIESPVFNLAWLGATSFVAR